jgi:hypothetical protein
LLTNLETSSEKLVQIILCGQPELEHKLRQSNVRQLRQRIFLWCRTQAITAEQTEAYIAQRLLIAGTAEPLFQPDAVALVHRASRGIPRIINLICENALISGYVEQVHRIRAPLVAEVVADLDLDGSAFAASDLDGDSYIPQKGFSGRSLPKNRFEEDSLMDVEPEEVEQESPSFVGAPTAERTYSGQSISGNGFSGSPVIADVEKEVVVVTPVFAASSASFAASSASKDSRVHQGAGGGPNGREGERKSPMSKIYDALVRAEMDRASAASNRTDSDSPEATLTRDILASLSQDRWPPTKAAAPVAQVVEEQDWRATADPEGVFPEPIAVWNPAHQSQAEGGDETGVPPVPLFALKTCPNCSLPYGARTERKGFFQKKIASFFGYFPWTCKACRVNFYSKDRGASPPEAAQG